MDGSMFKRFSVALAALFVLATSAFGAGTLPGFSLSQQMGKDGKPLAGCILKFYQAGTVATPQTAYQDSGLTIPVSGGAQMTCDAFGRIGQFFLADGSIKILLTDKLGVTQVTADGILVVGASSGGGGGSPVDPTTVLTTGDLKFSHGTGVLSGFVRANGRTIGSATSGASERANADTSALFIYLCGADTNLVMTPARSGNCANDFSANKVLATPDYRGRTLAGLDDMGNSAAGRLTAAFFGATATVLGATGGLEGSTLVLANLPPHTHSGTTSVETSQHTHGGGASPASTTTGAVVNAGASAFFWTGGSAGNTAAENQTHTHNFTTDGGAGSSFPVRTVQPTILATIYLKL